MKISVDGKELFELSDIQKKVIQDNIPSDIFEEDMKRRLQWVLMHKYQECFKQMKGYWESKLQNVVDSIPTDPDKLAELIFSQPDYQCRKMRDQTAEKIRNGK